MSEWQAIETAPKDGTIIDLWVIPNPATPKWRNLIEATRFENVRWENPGWFFKGGWSCSMYGLIPKEAIPTHWRPVPEPPTTKQDTP